MISGDRIGIVKRILRSLEYFNFDFSVVSLGELQFTVQYFIFDGLGMSYGLKHFQFNLISKMGCVRTAPSMQTVCSARSHRQDQKIVDIR